MSWKTFATPLIIIALGVMIAISVMAAPADNTTLSSHQDDYTAPEQTANAQTATVKSQTAQAQSLQNSAYPDSSTATPTFTPTTTTTATTSGTTTPTATSGPGVGLITTTPTTTSETISATPQLSPSATSISPTPADEQPASTATAEASTPTPASELTCTPGSQVTISGDGPPRAPFLIWFGQRVVGGGSVSPVGHFSVPLVIGSERPGVYDIIVRVRGSSQVLRELQCVVPPTPTPTPIRGQIVP